MKDTSAAKIRKKLGRMRGTLKSNKGVVRDLLVAWATDDHSGFKKAVRRLEVNQTKLWHIRADVHKLSFRTDREIQEAGEEE